MSAARRQSAQKRLRDMPHVFSKDAMSDMSEAGARALLSRWAKDGHVSPVGGKTGLYYNLVALACPVEEARARRMPQVLERLFGQTLSIGPGAMRVGGWDQSGRVLNSNDVAVFVEPGRRTLPRIAGVHLVGRGPEWWRAIEGARTGHSSFAQGHRALDPAWAWVDSLLFEGTDPPADFEDIADDVRDGDDFDPHRDDEACVSEALAALDALGPLAARHQADRARDQIASLCEELDLVMPDEAAPKP